MTIDFYEKQLGRMKRQMVAKGKAAKIIPVALGATFAALVLTGLLIFGVTTIPVLAIVALLAVAAITGIVAWEIGHS